MSEHQLSMFDKVIEILLDSSCENSDSDTLKNIYKWYLFDNSKLELSQEREPTW